MSKQSNENPEPIPQDPASGTARVRFRALAGGYRSRRKCTAAWSPLKSPVAVAPVVGYNPYDAKPGQTPALARVPEDVVAHPSKPATCKRKPTDLRR